MIKRFKKFLQEELDRRQKIRVDDWAGPHTLDTAYKFTNHLFPETHSSSMNPEHHRVSVPLEPSRITPPSHISDHLEKHGYKIKDYGKGIVTDKYGRENKIGKALSRSGAPEHFVHKAAEDKEKASSAVQDSEKYKVIISRHPYDVAGMSTNRSWRSCMNMGGNGDSKGEYHKTLEHDLEHGTHVAYLVHHHDHDIQNPIARIALKPLAAHDDKILEPENKSYPSSGHLAHAAFHETVRKWARGATPPKDDKLYKMDGDLYNDSGIKDKITYSPEKIDHILKTGSTTEAGDLAHSVPVKHLKPEHLYHPSSFVRETVASRISPEHLKPEHLDHQDAAVGRAVAYRLPKEHIHAGLLDHPNKGVARIMADRLPHDQFKPEHLNHPNENIAREASNRIPVEHLKPEHLDNPNFGVAYNVAGRIDPKHLEPEHLKPTGDMYTGRRIAERIPAEKIRPEHIDQQLDSTTAITLSRRMHPEHITPEHLNHPNVYVGASLAERIPADRLKSEHLNPTQHRFVSHEVVKRMPTEHLRPEHLDHPDPMVRRIASQRINPEHFTTDHLNHRDPSVANQAIRRISPEHLRPEHLNHPYEDIAMNAAERIPLHHLRPEHANTRHHYVGLTVKSRLRNQE